MKAHVRIGGEERLIEGERQGDCWTYRLDGAERSASVVEVEPGVYSVLAEGRSYEVRVDPDGEAMSVALGGRRFHVTVVDPREWRRPSRGISAEGPQSVVAPMPGRVVRVLMGEGDAVEAGQGLVVVEAMKMQNEIQAPKSGRVVSIPVAAGAAVAAGDVLAVVE